MTHPAPLPSRGAEPVAEFPEAVGTELRRLPGDRWAIDDGADHVFLLDDHLRLLRRFRVPGNIHQVERLGFDIAGAPYTYDISPDGTLAIFAGVHHTACVTPDGRVVWEIEHAALLNSVCDLEHAGAVFPAGGGELWVFVPVPDEDLGFGGNVASVAERWVLSLSDLTVSARSESAYTTGSSVLLHPDGRHISATAVNAHDGVASTWTRWDDNGALVSHAWQDGIPLDVRRDGAAWLANQAGRLHLHFFDDPERDVIEEDCGEHESDADHALRDACFLTEDLVLAASNTQAAHLLRNAATLERTGAVAYPEPFHEEGLLRLGSRGDGTWATVSRPAGRPDAQLRLWRLMPAT